MGALVPVTPAGTLPEQDHRECDCFCGDQSLHWKLSRASCLVCGCHSFVGSTVCSPVGVEAPHSLRCLRQWHYEDGWGERNVSSLCHIAKFRKAEDGPKEREAKGKTNTVHHLCLPSPADLRRVLETERCAVLAPGRSRSSPWKKLALTGIAG